MPIDFPFKSSGGLNAVEHHQLIGEHVDRATDADHVGAAHRCVGDAASGHIADLNILRHDRRDADGRAADINQIDIEPVLFVKTRVLRDGPDLIERVRGAVRDFDFVLRLRVHRPDDT